MSQPADTTDTGRRTDSSWTLWLLLAALTLMVGAGLFGDRGALRSWAVYRQKLELQAEIGQLRAEADALRQRIHLLQTDPRTVERLARAELGMVRPNEIIYQFPSDH